MKEKCDHLLAGAELHLGFHLIKKSETEREVNKWSVEDQKLQFHFCPLCGSSLRETALDRVLWRAVNKPNPGGLFPSQSLEHAVEFLKLLKDKVGESYISLDKITLDDPYYEGIPFTHGWGVMIKATEFFSASLSKALTKALLWATTELTKETVESLIKEEET